MSGKLFPIKDLSVNSYLANSPSVCLYTASRTLQLLHLRLTGVFWSITFKTAATQDVNVIIRNAKEYRSMTVQLMSQYVTWRSLRVFLFNVILTTYLLAGANNRNVIITQRFHADPVQANKDFFFWHTDCIFQL